MSTAPDVDAALEQAWQNLYAKLDTASQRPTVSLQGEGQALAIIKTLGHELLTASRVLEKCAEAFKFNGALKLANQTILHARRAREAAQSVLG